MDAPKPDSSRQIRQMVDFIKLEAKEKANELRAKTEHDFTLEKQVLVHNAKVKLNEEFSRREKDLHVQQLIQTSKNVGEQRSRKLMAREQLMNDLEKELLGKLGVIVSDKAAYTKLLAGLIEQGATKLAEKDIVVVCRAVDDDVVRGAVKEASSHLHAVSVTLDTDTRLPVTCVGGLKLTGLRGRITCDNTLEARARLAIKDLQPVVRYLLFPSARSAVLEKPAT